MIKRKWGFLVRETFLRISQKEDFLVPKVYATFRYFFLHKIELTWFWQVTVGFQVFTKSFFCQLNLAIITFKFHLPISNFRSKSFFVSDSDHTHAFFLCQSELRFQERKWFLAWFEKPIGPNLKVMNSCAHTPAIAHHNL